ncbi:hypothetical protein Gpo141_00005493 [Globisporangium polare]
MDLDTRVALRVGDLFNAQAAEASYQRLVDFLNQQALETQRLRTHLRELEAQQKAKEALATEALDERLARVNSRLVQLEQHVQLQSERNEHVNERATRLEKAAMDAARDRKGIRTQVGKLEQTTTKMIFQVRTEAASFELVNSLQIDQQLLHDRVSTMDRRLDTKMEKSESSRMEALVAKINAFAPKSDQLFEKLAALDESQTQVFKTLDNSEERWKIHSQDCSRVKSQLKTAMSTVESVERALNGSITEQLSHHGKQIEQLGETAADLVTKASTSDAVQRAMSTQFRSFVAGLTEQLKQQSEKFQALINERARNAEVSKKLAALQKELDEKAHWDDLQRVAEEAESLTIQCSELEKHVQLSSRFMNWFATRGEAYEHNLEVVETQLGRIAYASRPEAREPFGEQVRFPHR